MTLKTTLAALALTLAPSVALAMGGCSDAKHEQTAMSCAQGQVFDAAKGACVPQPSS
jgi:hypothetical protein